ncbi:MAG TPA: nicotinamide riboside transporter PnuC [Vicinamibacterales bacterium]|nr:nicotinamide riboside transporter PnuC [Vicinamibacterales bacterium]
MLEKIAVAAGLANVYLTVRQNIWCWPVGVVMVSLYIYIFFQAKLYSDAGLNVFFLVMQFYGWYEWTRGPVEHARSLRPVTRLSRRGGIVTIAGVLAGTVVLGTGMHQHTDAALPYPDAFTTMLSVFAQFLMTRKILENWTLWMIADVIYIGVYLIKSLYWTAGLYVVFLVLCVQGYREWKASRPPTDRPRRRQSDG